MTKDKGKAYYQDKIREKTDDMAWMPLPGLDWALAPDWAVFYDDISNREQFNERFIESRVAIGGMASALKLFAFSFFFVVIFLIWGSVSGDLDFSDALGIGIAVVMVLTTGAFFIIALTHSRPAPVRFNRQAQLVHVTTLPKREVVTVPWREVQPFIHFSRDTSGWYNLKLLFPVRSQDKNKNNNEPLEVPGAFASVDWVQVGTALRRWDFIRAYMEGGLENINIANGDKNAKLEKPSGYSSDYSRKKFLDHAWEFTEKVLIFPFYFENMLKRREANFRWPEEVERLCAPGADLSDLDTRPIRSHKNTYYIIDKSKGLVWGTPEEIKAQINMG